MISKMGSEIVIAGLLPPPDAVAWGNQILRETVPCDLLVIDELGPLEFNREEGWIKAFDVLESGDYRSALVVIRPTLLDDALERWDVERIINVDDPDDAYRDGKALFALLSDERADA
jgi:nucleoside-triphosphatase THEP1